MFKEISLVEKSQAFIWKINSRRKLPLKCFEVCFIFHFFFYNLLIYKDFELVFLTRRDVFWVCHFQYDHTRIIIAPQCCGSSSLAIFYIGLFSYTFTLFWESVNDFGKKILHGFNCVYLLVINTHQLTQQHSCEDRKLTYLAPSIKTVKWFCCMN